VPRVNHCKSVQVKYNNNQCSGTVMNSHSEAKQLITINYAVDSYYLFAVQQYEDSIKNDLESTSEIRVYLPEQKDPYSIQYISNKILNEGPTLWLGFCMNGKEGVNSIRAINKIWKRNKSTPQEAELPNPTEICSNSYD